MEGPANRPISEVHPYLRECTVRISEFSNSIRELLDTVVVASQWVNKGDILTAWNNWTDYLDLPCQAVRVSAEKALDFTDSPDYGELSKEDQERYWNYLSRADNRFVIMKDQLWLYQLLSQTEHTEQTVDFLWGVFESTKAYFFILHKHRQLKTRWISRHTNRCIKVRDRLCIEIEKLMNLLEKVIAHPAFETMDGERKELYHAKWRTYLKKCQQLNSH